MIRKVSVPNVRNVLVRRIPLNPPPATREGSELPHLTQSQFAQPTRVTYV